MNGIAEHPLFNRQAPDGLIELKSANSVCKGFSGAPLFDKNGAVTGMIRIVPQTIRESGSMLDVARATSMETIIKKFPSYFLQDRDYAEARSFVDEPEKVINPTIKKDTSSRQAEIIINNVQGDQYNDKATNQGLGHGNTFNAPIYISNDSDRRSK